jgi:CotH kinase protein/Lamin Tail Domain/Chitobiase/beta-hexosaminidase C-terminal domain/Divergent InlB B-repeat domain
MQFRLVLFLLLAGGGYGLPLVAQTLQINELMSDNQTIISDEAGDYDDWVELYNGSSAVITLDGWWLSDDPDNPLRWQIPASNVQIAPGAYLLIWLDNEAWEGLLHGNFRLSSGGESLLLSRPDSQLVDWVNFPNLQPDISYTRDDNGEWGNSATPTPGTENPAVNLPVPVTDEVVADVSSGYKTVACSVQLTCATPNAVIRYRTDGAAPGPFDAIYQGPLLISSGTTLRARAYAPGYARGPVRTFHYLFDAPSTFPTVALAFDPPDFFDPATGIYTNFATLFDERRPVSVTWLEPNGSIGFEQKMEAELQGIASLTNPQKSLLLHDEDEINYRLFPKADYTDFNSFILRNSGQDWNITMFRDAFVTDLGRDYSDVQPVLDTLWLQFQGFVPSHVYFNGAYYGIHNVREQIGAELIRHRYGFDKDSISLIENYAVAMRGDSMRWLNFLTWVQQHQFGAQMWFDSLAARNDMLNFTDYVLFQIMADNVDWPIKNWRRFTGHGPHDRWTWLPYDFDLSSGLLTNTGWNTGYAGQNAWLRALDSTFTYPSSPDWSTLLLRKVIANEGYRHQLLNRLADLNNTLFLPDRVAKRLQAFKVLYQPEIGRHLERWGGGAGSMPFWETNVDLLGQFWAERPSVCMEQTLEVFASTTTGLATVDLQVSPPEAGRLRFSTLQFDTQHIPWSGTYFTDVPIKLQAIPKAGWRFSRWEGDISGHHADTTVMLSGNSQFNAVFEVDSLPPTTDSSDQTTLNALLQPNPGKGLLLIQTDWAVSEWRCFHLTGQQIDIQARVGDLGNHRYQLDLQHLPSGVYLLWMRSGERSGTQRLVIDRR